jgi:hypothetical protein
MKTTIKSLFLAAGLAALAAPVAAQSTDPGTPKPTERAAVQPRKKNQQKRSAHVVQSGQITAGEATSLERKEAGLNAEKPDMREDNHARITSARHAQLRHHQNEISKTPDPHTQPVTVAKNVSQQHRAAELKTGQLTTRQGTHLATKETSFHHQIHSDREQDRMLTPKDEAQTNQIHLKKHNARMF